MTFVHQVMLYFCTAVCVMYLLSGGSRAVRAFWRRPLAPRAAAPLRARPSAFAPPAAPLLPEQPS
ncbi:DUF1378 family protein [Escherichia coli]|nr:DUF1378 family protein [Escherichia coli]